MKAGTSSATRERAVEPFPAIHYATPIHVYYFQLQYRQVVSGLACVVVACVPQSAGSRCYGFTALYGSCR